MYKILDMAEIPIIGRTVIDEMGWKALGRLARQSRDAQNWSLRDLVAHLKSAIPVSTLGTSTLSGFERGNVEPKVSTLFQLSLLGYIKDPITGVSMSVDDMCRYAAGFSDEVEP